MTGIRSLALGLVVTLPIVGACAVHDRENHTDFEHGPE
jgi:hypothetical protein